MAKRYAFVAMVFSSENTRVMVLVQIHLTLYEILAVAYCYPYEVSKQNRRELFNLIFAYVIFMIMQVFYQKTIKDYSEEDQTINTSELTTMESDLFVSPQHKEAFGWVCCAFIFVYLATHMTWFGIPTVKYCISKCKNYQKLRQFKKLKESEVELQREEFGPENHDD